MTKGIKGVSMVNREQDFNKREYEFDSKSTTSRKTHRRELLFMDVSPPYFEPEVHSDFGTTSADIDKNLQIPHIIHQTWSNESVPQITAPLIKTFISLNPEWTYFFWTDQTARAFIKDKFDYFLPTWDSYKDYMNRADAIRYFVLYEYGGVYVDIDFECLRPLKNVTLKYPAIFPVEPFEHSAFRMDQPYLINNAIMLSRPKHPFLKQLINRLELYSRRRDIIDVAGPQFLTNEFNRFNNISQNDKEIQILYGDPSVPFFYKSVWKYSQGNMDSAIYVPNTHYFMNTLAMNFETKAYTTTCKSWLNKIVVSCRPDDQRPLCKKPSALQKRACNELFRRSSRSLHEHFRFTFTRHHWFSSYDRPKVNLQQTVDIRTIVQRVVFYKLNNNHTL